MSTYTRKRCPICKSVLEHWRKNNEFWRTHIGIAVERCPMCKRNIRCGSNVEVIMLKHPNLFVAQYLAFDAIKSALFGAAFGLLFWGFVRRYGIGPEMSILFSIIILFVLHCLSLKRSIKDSISRTSSYEYCKTLREMGLINDDQLEAVRPQ